MDNYAFCKQFFLARSFPSVIIIGGDGRCKIVLPTCWELKNCGRTPGGKNVAELGVCPAHPAHGHSCWIIAGTFCGGEVQGTYAKKMGTCLACEVYRRYSNIAGSDRERLKAEHHEEWSACVAYFRGLQRT
jgi:hypothetical protein